MQTTNPIRSLSLAALGVLLAAGVIFALIFVSRAPAPVQSPDGGLADEPFAQVSSHESFVRWLGEWRTLEPFLSVEGFRKAEPAAGAIAYPRPPEFARPVEPQEVAEPMAGRYAWNPERDKFADVLASYGEPDSLVNVFNRDGRGYLEALAFCGTPCTFDDAYWLDGSTLVVLGNAESLNVDGTPRCVREGDPSTCYRYLTVTRYDFAAGTFAAWRSPDAMFAGDAFAEQKRLRFEASTFGGADGGTVLTDANITIESPVGGGLVGANFVLRGMARTFEQTVRYRITNERTGRVLRDSFTTAEAAELGKYGAYSHDVTLDPDDLKDGDQLTIQAFQDDAESGEERDSVQIVVTYKSMEE